MPFERYADYGAWGRLSLIDRHSNATFSAGTPATTQMAVQYGTGPMVWIINTLPPGLSLSAGGLWSGTSTASSTPVVITVTDNCGESSSKAFTVVVA